MLNFFKIVPLEKNIQLNGRIVSYSSNSVYKVFCTTDQVQIFWRDWECITMNIRNLKHSFIVEEVNYLILLGQHSFTNKIYIDVYIFTTEVGRKNLTLISDTILENNLKVTALSAFNIFGSLFISIGFDNGSICYSKNTLRNEIPAGAFKYLNVTTKPIKGIKFLKNRGNVRMFVCSDAGIFCFTISNNVRLSDTKVVLDDMESSIHCIALTPSFGADREQCLVVARDDGLYYYTTEGRGPCYALNGFKQIVEILKTQFIVVLKNKEYIYSHEPSFELLIYDTDNKIMVLNREFNNVACLLPVSDHNNCLIVLKSGEIFTLKEKDLNYKLSHLIKKNLYDIAFKILEKSDVNLNVATGILVQYGDYLLQRGDTSAAVIAYSKTIGAVPSFSIIAKFLEFRHNEFLVQYLSLLVQTEFQLPEHLQLLNNCLRRRNLPEISHQVFAIEDNKMKQLCVDYATNNCNAKLALLVNNLKQNRFTSNFFCEWSNSEIIQFLSEHGYYLMKEYPGILNDLIKHALSDRFLKLNMFNRLLLPLLLMNKLCASHVIENFKDCEINLVYNTLTELILGMWCGGRIETDFVTEFFRSHQPEVCIGNIFVLCRQHKFWPGIKMMHDKCNMEIFSTQCLAKYFQFFPEYVDIYFKTHNSNELDLILIQILKQEKFAKYNTLKCITNVIRNVINSNPYSVLNIINILATRNDFLIFDLNEFIVQETCLKYFKCDELYTVVSYLDKGVIRMEEVLDNYLKRPIEFRNRSCDICKQTIKLPYVFFLCQHSFHRECITQFNEILECNICTDIQNSKIQINNIIRPYECVDDNIRRESTIFMEISKMISQFHFKYTDNLKTEAAGNPFERETIRDFSYNEYDNNLNHVNINE